MSLAQSRGSSSSLINNFFNPTGECHFSVLLGNVFPMIPVTVLGSSSSVINNFFNPTGKCQLSVLLKNCSRTVSVTGLCSFLSFIISFSLLLEKFTYMFQSQLLLHLHEILITSQSFKRVSLADPSHNFFTGDSSSSLINNFSVWFEEVTSQSYRI